MNAKCPKCKADHSPFDTDLTTVELDCAACGFRWTLDVMASCRRQLAAQAQELDRLRAIHGEVNDWTEAFKSTDPATKLNAMAKRYVAQDDRLAKLERLHTLLADDDFAAKVTGQASNRPTRYPEMDAIALYRGALAEIEKEHVDG